MAVIPRSAFRALLADCSRSTFASFVTALWRAQGYEVDRDGDRLIVDGEVLLPVTDAGREPPDGGRLVVAAPLESADDAIGADALHERLLYGVERDRAAVLFEEHFGRPLDDDWTDLGEGPRDADGASRSAPQSQGRGRDSSEDDALETGEEPRTEDLSTGDPDSAAAGDPGRAAVDEPPPVLPAPIRSFVRSLDDAVPRDREAALTVARDRRVLAAAVLVVVASGGAWWGLFVHQPAAETPSAAPFETTDATYPVDGAYRIVARFRTTVDGETYSIRGTRTYAPGDPSMTLVRWTYRGPSGRTTVVRYERNGSFTRQTWTTAAEYRSFRDAHRNSEEFVRAVDATRTVYTADRDDVDGDVVFGLGLPLSTLGQVAYERRETTTHDGREVVRYVPESGWVTRSYGLLGDRQTTWVRTASGEVLVDPDDGDVLYADVDATVVEADTWGSALTDRGTSLTIRYEVQSGVERPERPPWVEEVKRQRAASQQESSSSGPSARITRWRSTPSADEPIPTTPRSPSSAYSRSDLRP